MGVPDPPCAYLRAQLGWPPAVPFVHPHDLPNRAKQLFLEAYEPGWAERQMAEPNGGIEVGPTPRRMHAGGGLPRERAAEIILVLCATSNGFGCLLPQWGIPTRLLHRSFPSPCVRPSSFVPVCVVFSPPSYSLVPLCVCLLSPPLMSPPIFCMPPPSPLHYPPCIPSLNPSLPLPPFPLGESSLDLSGPDAKFSTRCVYDFLRLSDRAVPTGKPQVVGHKVDIPLLCRRVYEAGGREQVG